MRKLAVSCARALTPWLPGRLRERWPGNAKAADSFWESAACCLVAGAGFGLWRTIIPSRGEAVSVSR
jgi:hypothetical protein